MRNKANDPKSQGYRPSSALKILKILRFQLPPNVSVVNTNVFKRDKCLRKLVARERKLPIVSWQSSETTRR